jgi:hypothetical protein
LRIGLKCQKLPKNTLKKQQMSLPQTHARVKISLAHWLGTDLDREDLTKLGYQYHPNPSLPETNPKIF